ncbi:hypothetical protein E2C01_009769 [Portunus trituberculatus]|uniref:Uncharacterized protein n=1 Tax=Portunus trituberculatus TaxID=210409 RepID=A0A5B7D6M6_PORTR|nr:hypothetical protein [Portunus trituberculatus]
MSIFNYSLWKVVVAQDTRHPGNQCKSDNVLKLTITQHSDIVRQLITNGKNEPELRENVCFQPQFRKQDKAGGGRHCSSTGGPPPSPLWPHKDPSPPSMVCKESMQQ